MKTELFGELRINQGFNEAKAADYNNDLPGLKEMYFNVGIDFALESIGVMDAVKEPPTDCKTRAVFINGKWSTGWCFNGITWYVEGVRANGVLYYIN